MAPCLERKADWPAFLLVRQQTSPRGLGRFDSALRSGESAELRRSAMPGGRNAFGETGCRRALRHHPGATKGASGGSGPGGKPLAEKKGRLHRDVERAKRSQGLGINNRASSRPRAGGLLSFARD